MCIENGSQRNNPWMWPGVLIGCVLIIAGLPMLIIGAVILGDGIIPGVNAVSNPLQTVGIVLVVFGCLFIIAGIIVLLMALCCWPNCGNNNVSHHHGRQVIHQNYVGPQTQYVGPQTQYVGPQPVYTGQQQNVVITRQQGYSTGGFYDGGPGY